MNRVGREAQATAVTEGGNSTTAEADDELRNEGVRGFIGQPSVSLFLPVLPFVVFCVFAFSLSRPPRPFSPPFRPHAAA